LSAIITEGTRKQPLLSVKDVYAGLVSSWNATVQRTGFQEHVVRPGDVVVCLNVRSFDEQALEQDCKKTLDIWFIFRGNRERAEIAHWQNFVKRLAKKIKQFWISFLWLLCMLCLHEHVVSVC
jgi:hypothetical protein